MPIKWEDPPKEAQTRDVELNDQTTINWAVPESDVTASGMATAFLSGIAQTTFTLTGGSTLEYILDEIIPEDSHALYGIKAGGGKAIDWGKDHTLVNYAPDNQEERVARRAGEDMAIGAVMAAAAVASSGSAAPLLSAAKASPNLAQKVLSSILTTFHKHPMTASIIEMTSAAGAGAGMEMAKEGGAGPAGQTAAGFAGAFAPFSPLLAYKGLSYSAAGLVARVSQRSSKKAFEEVAKALDTGIGDMSDLRKANRVFDTLGSTKRPSVAEASNSPQLIARQKQIEAEAVGSELDHYVKLHADKTNELNARAEALGPEVTGRESQTVIDVSRARLEAQRSSVASEIEDVDSMLSVTGKLLPESTDRIAAGRQLKALRDTIREDVKDTFSSEADEIGLNTPGSEFDATDFRDTVRAAFFDARSKFASKIKNKNLKRINKMSEDVGADGKPTGRVSMTWEDLTAIRESLDDDISVLMAHGKRNKARPLINAKGMLDRFIDDNAPNGVDPEAWSSFRARYKTEVIERFEKGTSYKISGANNRGEYFTNEEMVAEAFLRSESTVADFFRLYGGQADEALPLLRNAILDRARSAAVTDGVVNEKALGKFIETGPLSKILRSFPAVRQELIDTRTATKALSVRSAALNKRAREIESSSLKSILELSGDPDAMLDAALRSPQKMAALVTSSQSAGLGRRPVASLVWRRAIDNISDGAEPTPDQLLKFIKSHRLSLNEALGKRHAETLRTIYEADAIIARIKAPSGAVEPFSVPDVLRSKTGISVPQVASRYFAISYGLIGKRQMMVESAMRFYGKFAGRKAKALMKEALYDENIARDIMRLMETPAMRAQRKLTSLPEQRLNAALFTMGMADKEQ